MPRYDNRSPVSHAQLATRLARLHTQGVSIKHLARLLGCSESTLRNAKMASATAKTLSRTLGRLLKVTDYPEGLRILEDIARQETMQDWENTP